jgi:hypothetical protein
MLTAAKKRRRKEAHEHHRRGAPVQALAATGASQSARGPTTRICSSVNQARPKSTPTTWCRDLAARPDGARWSASVRVGVCVLGGFGETPPREVRHGERGPADSGGDNPQNIRRDARSAGPAASLSSRRKVYAFVDDWQSARLRPFQHVPKCRSLIEQGDWKYALRQAAPRGAVVQPSLVTPGHTAVGIAAATEAAVPKRPLA